MAEQQRAGGGARVAYQIDTADVHKAVGELMKKSDLTRFVL